MKEITRIEKICDFNELSESAKDNARCRYLENFHEADMFTDMCEDRIKEDFPNSNLEVQYSLSSCQGDGLNIYGQFAISDIIKFIRTHYEQYDCILNYKQKRFMNYLEKQEDITIENKSNTHYCYYTDKANDVSYYIEYDFENNYFRDIPYDTIQIIANMFDVCFKKYCKVLEEEGYSYFYEVDDDEIIDVWEANEYLGWTKEGEPVYQ